MDLNSERGISYQTRIPLFAEPAPVEFAKLVDGSDPHWVGHNIPWHQDSFLKPITHFRVFSPIKILPNMAITDVWMRFIDQQERFTNEMLGSVTDHCHRMVENYRPDSI